MGFKNICGLSSTIPLIPFAVLPQAAAIAAARALLEIVPFKDPSLLDAGVRGSRACSFDSRSVTNELDGRSFYFLYVFLYDSLGFCLIPAPCVALRRLASPCVALRASVLPGLTVPKHTEAPDIYSATRTGLDRALEKVWPASGCVCVCPL